MPEQFLILLILLPLLTLLLLVLTRRIRYSERRGGQEAREWKPILQEEEGITTESIEEDLVKAVVTQRIEGIKNRDASSIASLVDSDSYTKFDDWPPFERQEGPTVLKNEAEALKALKEYDYEISDWKVGIFDNAALVSFIIHYQGRIRNMGFNIRSRVTAFLLKREKNWKIIHEHWSRIP